MPRIPRLVALALIALLLSTAGGAWLLAFAAVAVGRLRRR